MTFEEFFKKKRIDLDALQKSEPALFSEFKTHYEQMGEKSFDHTKKYWFNKVRRQYQLAAEIKTEKPKIENQLAEQTITEAIIDEGRSTIAPAPKLGFVPKFKAATTPKPLEEEKQETVGPTEAPAPKLGFTPKFKAASPPKTVEEVKPETPEPTEVPAPKLGFTPKFKAATLSKPGEEKPEVKDATEVPAPKLGFTPKFKAANMPKVVAEAKPEEAKSEQDSSVNPLPETDAPKPAYKPRFNMKNIPSKPPEE